jgi:dTDP-4-dehydrorhamnose 3,5-epimerase
MNFTPTAIPEVVMVEPKVFGDSRGFFMETWHAEKFAAAGIGAPFVQDNHSASAQWVLRGLHFQLRRPQGKMVRVVVGEVLDVAVDLRRSSPTFGRHVAVNLSAGNRRMLWVPPGFAHGFLVLSERAEFVYKCTDFYDPGSERTLRWDDPAVGIDWPLPKGTKPEVSAKDAAGHTLATIEAYS